MTLPNVILFPQAMLPLYIFEPRYRLMLAESLCSHRMFSVALQKPDREIESPTRIAGLGLIRASVQNKDGTSHLVLQGLTRVKLKRTLRRKPYRIHAIDPLKTLTRNPDRIERLEDRLMELVRERLDLGFHLPIQLFKGETGIESPGGEEAEIPLAHALRQSIQMLSKLNDVEQLVDLISCTLLSRAHERQLILEALEVDIRLRRLIQFLKNEIQRTRSRPSL